MSMRIKNNSILLAHRCWSISLETSAIGVKPINDAVSDTESLSTILRAGIKLGIQSLSSSRGSFRGGNLITQNVALSRSVTDRGNLRQTLPFGRDAERCRQFSDMRRVGQPNQMWKFRVKRPDLKPGASLG